MPGHAGAAARAYPEFFDGNHTFNPANPGTYRFIDTVLAEVTQLFPGRYIHFGGDEVGANDTGWRCPTWWPWRASSTRSPANLISNRSKPNLRAASCR